MSWTLFLDDERFPHEGDHFDEIARSYEEAIAIVECKEDLPVYISFDHDLGDGRTGYDFARWIVDYCLDYDIDPNFDYYVHSQNPVGAGNIYGLLDNFIITSGCKSRRKIDYDI